MARTTPARLRSDDAAAELTIGEVAQRVGLRASALRYYESVGLLPAPKRVNGRRLFAPEVVRRLNMVRFAQEAGFSISEIRTLFHGFGAHVPPSARWRQMASRKLTELDALVARAERMRDALHVAMQCGCLRIEDCEATFTHSHEAPTTDPPSYRPPQRTLGRMRRQ